MNIRCLVNTSCNYRCTFCHNEFQPETHGHKIDKDKTFDKNNLQDCISFIEKNHSLDALKISGGEPLLMKDEVLKILELSNKFSFRKKILLSNLALADEPFLNILANYGLNEIRVNIPSFDKDKYSKITNTNNKVLGKVLDNCMLARRKGIRIRINIVISNYSQEYLLLFLVELSESLQEYEDSIDEVSIIFDAYLKYEKEVFTSLLESLPKKYKLVSHSFRKYEGVIGSKKLYFRKCIDWELNLTDADRDEIRIVPPGISVSNFKKGRAYDF